MSSQAHITFGGELEFTVDTYAIISDEFMLRFKLDIELKITKEWTSLSSIGCSCVSSLMKCYIFE